MAELPRPDVPPTFRIWLSWTILTAVSALLGLVVIDTIILGSILRIDPDIALYGLNALGPQLLFGLGMVFFAAPLVGFAQGMVLRYITRTEGAWIKWIFTSVVAALLAVISTVTVAITICGGGDASPLMWVVLPGIVVGLAQSWILRSILPRAKGWVLAVSLAWVAASISGYIIRIVILPPTVGSRYIYPFYPLNEAISWGVCWVIGALIYGAITGWMLVRLLQQPPPATSPALIAYRRREE